MSEEIVTETKTAGRAAAEWWAGQIGCPTFKAVPDGDHPDREHGDFAAAMGYLIAARHPVRDGQGGRFVAELAPWIDQQLVDHPEWGVSLGVDYGPDLELARAAEAAGIHFSRFPWKTQMWARHDHVTAALGYHGRTRLIWSAPDWVRPNCGQHNYDSDMELVEANEVCSKPRYHEDECGDWQPDPDRCADCDGTYVDHYGKGRERRNHSWTVTR